MLKRYNNVYDTTIVFNDILNNFNTDIKRISWFYNLKPQLNKYDLNIYPIFNLPPDPNYRDIYYCNSKIIHNLLCSDNKTKNELGINLLKLEIEKWKS